MSVRAERRREEKAKTDPKLSRSQTESERAKWLKKLSGSKYVFHLGKKG